MAIETTRGPKPGAGRPRPGAAPVAWPDPVPEQQPWRTPDDAKGWRRVYHGKGRPHQVRSAMLLEPTPEQWAWLDAAAAAASVTAHEVVSKLIDEARAKTVG